MEWSATALKYNRPQYVFLGVVESHSCEWLSQVVAKGVYHNIIITSSKHRRTIPPTSRRLVLPLFERGLSSKALTGGVM